MTINQDFSTFDLSLATVLTALKYELVGLDKTNPKKIRFVFKRQKGIDQTIKDYWEDKINLPAQSLLNHQKLLKNRLYSDS